MRTLAFDDVEVGHLLEGSRRTITDVEVSLLPAVMGAISPLFYDEETMRAGPLGGRVLFGPALLGIVIGLTEAIFHDTALGLLEIEHLRFIKPVHPGDTVLARCEVLAKVETSRPDRGVVKLRDWAENQAGDRVLEFTRAIMLKRLSG